MPGPVQLAEQEEDAPKKKKKFMRSGKCLNCKEKGHLKMECPKLTEERRKELQVDACRQFTRIQFQISVIDN